MMIDLNNYETWFLQYADGECSPAEQQAVEAFLLLHPLLREELSAMMDMRLVPEKISMPGKDHLRFTELEQLNEQYRLEPDLQIQFPDKSLLHRKQRSRVIYLYRAIAAAAVLIISFGLYQLLSPADTVEQSVAASTFVAEPIDAAAQDKPMMTDEGKKDSPIILAVKIESNRKPAAIEPALVQEPVTEVYTDAMAQAEIIAPVQEEKKPLSNLSEEVLKAAASRMEATAIPISASSNLNAALIIEDATKPHDKKPLRSLVRTLARRVLHDNENTEEGQFIQVANFHIHVKN